MLTTLLVVVVLMILFFGPFVVLNDRIESMRKEMKSGLDDLDSRLKAIERMGDGVREDLHNLNWKIENSGKLWG